MAQDLDVVYIQTFEQNVQHLAQQMNTKLRGTVMERGVNGSTHSWELLDAFGNASIKLPYNNGVDFGGIATPDDAAAFQRRLSVAQTFDTGSVIDNEDIVQMLIEPKSSITTSLAMTMNRAIDDIIITAATADALDGDGTTVIPLPPSSIVGDGLAPISFDFITEVQERFMQNDIDPSQPKVAVIGPTQVRKLLQLTEQTSSDYVSRQALQELNASGIVMNWMGFTWVMSTRLESPAVDEINVLFYTEDALGLQVNEDITIQIAQDPSASFAWRLYTRLTMGATRVQDKKIVVGHLADVI